MRHGFFAVLVACAMLALAGTSYGQGGTSATLSGVVTDSGGGVVPGANVVIKHNDTGTTQSGVTNSQGVFSFPGLNVGTYTVTVSLDGFKTFIANNVVLTSGAGANVKAVLEVGGLSEQVVVSSQSEIVQTQTATISTTITTNQIIKLPLTSRSAMDFVTFMPGVQTVNGNRASQINGLPQGFINITLDGVNIQDNTNRSTDGFFAIVSPRLDAVEEVTVTTAGQGADAGGQGGAQVKFVTRSGTNRFTGSGYEYYRNDKLNANTWFNNRDGVARAKLLQNQYGFRVGGPIVIPGLYDGHNKAFFFVNYEEFHQPSETTRNRTLLNTQAQTGNFCYTVAGSPNNCVNLLTLASSKGELFSADPTISKLLQDIRSATGTTGSVTPLGDPNLDQFSYNLKTTSLRRYPTVRGDYNLTDKHRITSSFNYQIFTDYPDTLNNLDSTFPGFPILAGQTSKRLGFSNAMRSTLTSSLVNEVRVGYGWDPVLFFTEMSVDMFSGSVANQNGYFINFPSVGSNLTAAGGGNARAPQSRNATNLLIEDTVTWLKGKHSFSMGVSWTRHTVWLKNSSLVPSVTTGLNTGETAISMFTAANFPGASNANLTAAQNLYAFLTGRLSAVTADARLDDSGKYVYEGTGTQRGRMPEIDSYVQDQWRPRPNLTLNLGLRYAVQMPFFPTNNSYSTATMADVCGVSGVNASGTCNVFAANVASNGKHPTFINFGKGVKGYNVDMNNLAPSVGVAWVPAPRTGLLGKAIGHDGDLVIRGGFARGFSREGLGTYTGVYNSNPGITINVNRSASIGNLGTLPLLFRNSSQLAPPPFADTPQYPLTDDVTQDVRIIDPNIQVPYADSYNVGFSRTLGKNMSFEMRYVGTRSYGQQGNLNYNGEYNIIENNFLNEFRVAQANLQANIAAGRGNTFAYTGAAGTAPLPIFLAFFNAQGAANAGNTALYTGSNWTNANYVNQLAARNPQPFNLASNNANTGLMGNATLRNNAVAAGLPANFFVVNPELLGGAFVRGNQQDSKYNSLQMEFKRRLSGGLQFQSSYTYGYSYLKLRSPFASFRKEDKWDQDTGDPGEVIHALKLNVVYDLPFGRGQRFGSGVNPFVDRLINGWQIGVTNRTQTGPVVNLGNIRMVGMTTADVQKMFRLRFDDAGRVVYMWPQDVIDNTLAAYAVSATSASGYSGAAPTGRYFMPANGPDCIEIVNGYGDCGLRSVYVRGPMFLQTDIRISKRTQLVGKTNLEFAIEALNALNQVNYNPVSGIGSSALSGYRVTGLLGQNTARLIQLVARFNW